MPRRREVPKRPIVPDPKYKDKLVAKFVNQIMMHGKKATAERALYGSFDIIRDRFKQDPIEGVSPATAPIAEEKSHS